MSEANISRRTAQIGDGIVALLSRLLGSVERGTLLASASRTTTTATGIIDMAGRKQLLLYLNVSAASGTGGLFLQLQYLDPVSGQWMNGAFAPAAGKTTTGGFFFIVGPGISVGSGAAINAALASDRGTVLGREMRISVLHSDASSYTYSLGYEML